MMGQQKSEFLKRGYSRDEKGGKEPEGKNNEGMKRKRKDTGKKSQKQIKCILPTQPRWVRKITPSLLEC